MAQYDETPTMKAVRASVDPELMIKNLKAELVEIGDAYFRSGLPELSINTRPLPEVARSSVYMIRRLREQLKDSEKEKAEIFADRADRQRRAAIAEQKLAEAEKELAKLKEADESYPIREPHRLGLPDSGETFVDLPEVPQSFIDVFLAALDRFAAGYAEYGPGAADPLGLAGQWGDLHRKVMKLRRALWAGEKDYLTRETEEEVLQDIIGHSLLALEMLSRGMEGGRS